MRRTSTGVLGVAALALLGQVCLGASITDYCVFAGTQVNFGDNITVNGLVGGNDRLGVGGGTTSTLGFEGGGYFNSGNNVSTPLDVVANGDVDLGGGGGFRNVYSGGYVRTGNNVTITGEIIATDWVQLGGGVVVQGDITAGNPAPSGRALDTGNNCDMQANVKADGDVDMGGGTVIQGNLQLSGSVLGSGSVTGTTTVVPTFNVTPPAFTSVAIPGASPVTPSTLPADDVTTSTTAGSPLAPGAYRNVNLPNNQSLHLVGGTYEFHNFVTGGGLDLFLDLTGGPITVLVENNLNIGNSMVVWVWDAVGGAYVDYATFLADPTLRAMAADVFFEAQNAFAVGGSAQWIGTAFGPAANVSFGNNAQITGAVYSGTTVGMGGGSVLNCEAPNRFGASGSPPGAVPEPATVVLLGAAGALALWRRRRRQAAA